MEAQGGTEHRKWLTAGVWLIATVAIGIVLQQGAKILAPFAMAIFVWLVMEGFAGAIKRPFPNLPGWVAHLLAVVVVLLSIVTFISVVSGAIAEFTEKRMEYTTRINQVVRDIENMIPDLTDVMGQPAAGPAASAAPPVAAAEVAPGRSAPLTPGEAATVAIQEPAAAPAEPPPPEAQRTPDSLSRLLSENAMTIVTQAANVASGLFADMFLIFLYVAFLYVSVGTLSRKLDRIFVRPADRERARMVGADVRRTMEQYLWLQTAMSIINTSLTYVTLLVLGLDNALFWAFVIFVLNYIPTIGSFVAMFLPALFALVQPSWPGWMPQEPMWAAAAVFAGVAFWQFLIGNFLAPRVMSNSLNLAPVVVLLSLAVWGTIWGPLGMFLSAPLTVLVMIVLAQIPGARWIAVLLSADGNPGEYPVKADDPVEDLRHAQLTDI